MKIVLVSSGWIHPPFRGRSVLRRLLAQMPDIELQQAVSMENTPQNWEDLTALVLYMHHKRISDAALEKFERFVHQGGGVLAVHSATASYKNRPQYFEILGGRFTGHGAVESYTVSPVTQDIFSGIEAFTIRDEMYQHEMHTGVTVHFTTRVGGEVVPVVWTTTYGKGKLCYLAPGHTPSSLQHPAVQAILRRALAWVCGQ